MKVDNIRTVLITGGAGFIGSNLAERLLKTPGVKVRILDNLSRQGSVRNLEWLRAKERDNNLEFICADVRDAKAVHLAVAGISEIYHFAAQVAVTASLEDPVTDFQVNALGTLNVLEAARKSKLRPFLLFTSTNKVYGALHSVPIIRSGAHYHPKVRDFHGVDESQHLDFHSPYGCSKGTADQYVRDYARIFDLPTVVFRMSCIAGPRQFGNEDQGWVAHFVYSALADKPITIYGDGLQVRDILHVRDLIDAIIAARMNASVTRGKVYNMGGGRLRALSVLEMIHAIEKVFDRKVAIRRETVRPGDQPLYISDTAKFTYDTGWEPRLRIMNILAEIRAFWCGNLDNAEGQSENKIPVSTSAAEVA